MSMSISLKLLYGLPAASFGAELAFGLGPAFGLGLAFGFALAAAAGLGASGVFKNDGVPSADFTVLTPTLGVEDLTGVAAFILAPTGAPDGPLLVAVFAAATGFGIFTTVGPSRTEGST